MQRRVNGSGTSRSSFEGTIAQAQEEMRKNREIADKAAFDMGFRPPLIWPDKRLEEMCRPIDDAQLESLRPQYGDHEFRTELKALQFTCLRLNAGGLAAPQIGWPVRVAVVQMRPRPKEDGTPADSVFQILINPVLMHQDGRLEIAESCVSFPGEHIPVVRADKVRVMAADEHGDKIEVEGDGLVAVALQHELDHLDGKLIIDHASRLKRDLIRRRFEKKKRAGLRYVMPFRVDEKP